MQNLYNDLQDMLKNSAKFVSEGRLLKNKVIESTLSLDPELIGLLLKNENIKSHFFVMVNGSYIFDKLKFQQFVSNKSFLPDSYTAFKNKVGLAINDEQLQEQQEVVLNWPYKDCVLEGGQGKEDSKRSEVFWNEVLAPDQIDQLLSPKVLTNWSGYNPNGEFIPSEVTEDDSLLIKGNNLLAVSSLVRKYRNKVKLIYIDPPYNTENDEFKYNDKFSHSTWLTFMKNRLELSKDLLQKNGLLFIHIGDQEMHYLKVLTDNIFGRDNFIATIPRKTRSGKSDVPYKLSQDFDWMLVYTNGAPSSMKLFQRDIERKYYHSDDFPNDPWRLSDLTKQTSVKERPKSNFTLVNPKNGEEYPVNPNRSWAITTDTVDDYIKRNKIVFPGDYDFLTITKPQMRIFQSEEIKKYGEGANKSYVSSNFLNKAMDDLLSKTVNKNGTDEMVDLFGDKVFSYPKNELLLKHIIDFCTEEGDIVLDFFAGSGTTLAVAHKMNRRFIGVEQMHYINDVTLQRLKEVVKGEQGGISKEVNWQGGGSFKYAELKELNSVYIDKISKAESADELVEIWNMMTEKAFLSYKIDISSINKNINSFEELDLEEQKVFLFEVLDKNYIYVNYTEIEDEDYRVGNIDLKLNQMFYEEV
ncbi:DNA methyltransferase [Virgibacillus natechei]